MRGTLKLDFTPPSLKTSEINYKTYPLPALENKGIFKKKQKKTKKSAKKFVIVILCYIFAPVILQ